MTKAEVLAKALADPTSTKEEIELLKGTPEDHPSFVGPKQEVKKQFGPENLGKTEDVASKDANVTSKSAASENLAYGSENSSLVSDERKVDPEVVEKPLKLHTNEGDYYIDPYKDFYLPDDYFGDPDSRTGAEMSEEEAQQYLNDILLDNPLGLDVLDIVNQVSPNRALVYNLKNRRWDMWEAPNLTNIHSGISGKDGEPIISSQENIVLYTTNEEDRRDWEWTSKNITLGIDGKKKKFYKVLTQSNVDDDITEYSLDNGEFQTGDTINKKAKSIQLRIKSQDNIDAEVDSITLTYRDLPTSKKNV